MGTGLYSSAILNWRESFLTLPYTEYILKKSMQKRIHNAFFILKPVTEQEMPRDYVSVDKYNDIF